MNYIEPYKLHPNFGVSELHEFLKYCTSHGASDVVLQTGDRAWAEIYGRQCAATERTLKDGELKALLSNAFGPEVVGVIRAATDADRALRFMVQDDTFRYRVNIASAQVGDIDDGISITMRTIPETPPAYEGMNLPADISENLFQPKGLVLICGPTGSGKTTLMSSFYAHISETRGDIKILLYEDPIEFLFTRVKNIGPKIRQMQVGKHIGSFADGLRNAMRCAPKIIGIGEARDMPTISAAIEASLTGHGTYATMHTDSVPETISRAIQTFPPDQHSAVASKLLGALRMIVVQILVPTLDGKRRAVRERLYFDDTIRYQMSEMNYTQWGSFLRKVVREKGQHMAAGLKELVEANLINDETYRRYAGEANA